MEGPGEGWGDGAVSAAAGWGLRREASHCQSHLSMPDPGQPPQPPALAGSSVLLGGAPGPGLPGAGWALPNPSPLQFRPGGQHPREGKREGHDVLPALRSWTQTMASRSWSLCGDSSSCRRLASLRAQVEGDLHLCQDGVPPSLVPGSGPSLYLGVGVLCPASLCPLPIPRSKQVCQGSGL